MIRHDQLFKRLSSRMPAQFLQLFYPGLARVIDWAAKITPLDKELFEEEHGGVVSDLALQVKLRDKSNEYLILFIEIQSQQQSKFPERVYNYFSGLKLKYGLDVFSIALLTFDSPKRLQSCRYQYAVRGRKFVSFEYEQIQLNRLDWRHYRDTENPIAAALMTKMRIAKKDRPRVLYEALRLLSRFKLDKRKQAIIGKVIDTYLKLNSTERKVYESYLTKVSQKEREQIMDLTTSWERKGIRKGRREGKQKGLEKGLEQGLEQGRKEGALFLVLPILRKKFGNLNADCLSRIESLTLEQLELLNEALPVLSSLDDLQNWVECEKSRN